MPKPPYVPVWDSNKTNTSAPTAGHKSDGYANNEIPTAAEFNYQLNAIGEWCAYVDAGEWDDDIHVTGDATIDGALNVAGDVVGPVNVTGTVEADQLYFRSTQTKQLDIHGTIYGSFPVRNSGDVQSTAALQIVDVLIDLPLGAKIWGYSLRIKGNGTDNLTHKLVRIHTGGEIDVGATTMTAPAASWQAVFNNFAPVTVAAGERYVIRVTAGGDGQRVGWPTCDWTREAP